MKPIHRLIEHLVNNWQNNLHEALAPRIKQQLMTKFKDEAEDFDIKDPITKKPPTEEQISAWIDYFDSKLRNSPKVTEKDITQYSLAGLIKLVSSYKGSPEEKEGEDQIEENPDIVYQENGIIIYSGHNEENCIKFGKGEQWCITKSSFGNYRYDPLRKNPNFYLVKNTNLPDSDRSSFIVVVVGSDNTYKVSDRSNNDVGGRGSEWTRWEPWSTVESLFPFLQGLQRFFKYVPISKGEALSQVYKNNPISFEDWASSPPSFKEQYIIVRKGKEFFNDIKTSKFISKYISKYPSIAELIAKNYGMVDLGTLFAEFDAFTPNLQSSIIENAKRFISLKAPQILFNTTYEFSAKKAATKRGLIKPESEERVYVTQDDKGIVLLNFSSKTPKISLITAEKTYENVKVNERTIKFVTNYPNLNELPFASLMSLAKENLLSSQAISRVIATAKSDPNSAIVIKDTEEGQILIDSNTFTAYKIEDGNFSPIPFSDDTVQNIIQNETENSSFQDKVISILSAKDTISADAMPGIISILKNTPYNRRLMTVEGDDDDDAKIFLVNDTTNTVIAAPSADKTDISNFRRFTLMRSNKFEYNHLSPNKSDYQTWIAYLRSQNLLYNTSELLSALRRGYSDKKEFLLSNPPLTEDNAYQIVEWEGEVFLVNKANSRESLKISNSTGKVIKANIPPSLAARMRGVEAPAAAPAPARRERPATAAPTPQEPGVRRPGRPAGRPATPAAPVNAEALAAATTAMTDVGLANSWNALSAPIKNRFANATISNRPYGDRGAGRRDNILRGRGRVRQIVESGNNKIYIIRLRNDTFIASIVLQPGNSHLLVTPAGTANIGSPDNLLGTLQNQNLAESEKGMAVNMFLAENPHMLDETKEILRKHLNKNKYETQRS